VCFDAQNMFSFCKDNGKYKENTVRFDRYTMELSLQPNDCTLYIS
jgi:hypothetical protein